MGTIPPPPDSDPETAAAADVWDRITRDWRERVVEHGDALQHDTVDARVWTLADMTTIDEALGAFGWSPIGPWVTV